MQLSLTLRAQTYHLAGHQDSDLPPGLDQYKVLHCLDNSLQLIKKLYFYLLVYQDQNLVFTLLIVKVFSQQQVAHRREVSQHTRFLGLDHLYLKCIYSFWQRPRLVLCQ